MARMYARAGRGMAEEEFSTALPADASGADILLLALKRVAAARTLVGLSVRPALWMANVRLPSLLCRSPAVAGCDGDADLG